MPAEYRWIRGKRRNTWHLAALQTGDLPVCGAYVALDGISERAYTAAPVHQCKQCMEKVANGAPR